jgi:Zn-finger nucleic acid-binding protein
MDCPFCKTSLLPYEEHDLHLDRCPAGHGIWFDGGELDAYRKNHPDVGNAPKEETQRFLPLPGVAVKDCPRCRTTTLEGGRLHDLDVQHCFTCHGVFLGQPSPLTQDPLNPTPVVIGGMILQAILSGFG